MTDLSYIKDANLDIIKSIHSNFSEEKENTPVISHEKFEDLQKSHEIYSKESLDNFVKNVQDNFVKGLDENEDVSELKKGLEQAKDTLNSLEKAILVNEEGEKAAVFCKKKAQ